MMRSRPRRRAAHLLVAAALTALAAALPAPVRAQAPSGVSDADLHFMSGMIVHHAQAVLIAGWAASHGAGPSVRELCDRVVISQRDEMATMERWLLEHHQALPDTSPRASLGGMAAMPGMAMGGPAMMPGMLTPPQLAQLDSARGPAFDGLFLTFMIQHHRGALTMVAEYQGANGAGQDPFVFQFASDVNGDQTAEIDRMGRMLAAMPSLPRSP